LTTQNRAPHHVQGQQIFFRRKYDRNLRRPSLLGGIILFEKLISISLDIMSDFCTGLLLIGPGAAVNSFHVPRVSGSSVTANPQLYRSAYPYPNALGQVASHYQDESDSALGLLQQTYGGSEQMEESNKEEQQIHEQHDLFSQKMSEHLAMNLSGLKLEDQLEAFCKHILLSEPFLHARFKLIQSLQGLFQNRYPKCAIYPCGPDYIGIVSVIIIVYVSSVYI